MIIAIHIQFSDYNTTIIQSLEQLTVNNSNDNNDNNDCYYCYCYQYHYCYYYTYAYIMNSITVLII